MNSLNKTESAVFISLMCSLLPEDLHSELILHSNSTVLQQICASIEIIRAGPCSAVGRAPDS